jgi:hypothetical protein
MDSLHARTLSKSPSGPITTTPAPQRAPVPRPGTVVKSKPPQILQSGHAPAQLSFTFTRW